MTAKAAAESKCADLEDTKEVRGYLDYLKRDRSALNGSCIEYAISRIIYPAGSPGFSSYPEATKSEAINALVQYLDYRHLARSKAEEAVVSSRDPYPANTALFVVGKAAVPALIEVIGNPSTPAIARSNATWVIFLLFGTDRPEAVRTLKRAGEASDDAQASLRLFDAARNVAAMCTGPDANVCTDALYERDPQKY